MQNANPNLPAMMLAVMKRPSVIGKMRPVSTLEHGLAKQFSDPRLQQLFGRYATYVGGSPFNSPSLLQLIWYVEFLGVWRIRGGLHTLANKLKELSTENGVEFVFNKSVTKINIKDNNVCSVDLNDGQRYQSKTVIV